MLPRVYLIRFVVRVCIYRLVLLITIDWSAFVWSADNVLSCNCQCPETSHPLQLLISVGVRQSSCGPYLA